MAAESCKATRHVRLISVDLCVCLFSHSSGFGCWLHASPRGACIITNTFLQEQQKCHKLRKVNNITSMMNFFPQWYASVLNGPSLFGFVQLYTRQKKVDIMRVRKKQRTRSTRTPIRTRSQNKPHGQVMI